MSVVKRIFKRNTHNGFFKALAGFGRSMNRIYENRNHDIFSNGELNVLRKLARTNPSVIIDGGANVGKYALEVHRIIPDAQIYAFEPVRSTFEILTQKVQKFDRIKPIHKGLYREDCSMEINIFPANTHASIVDIQGLSVESKGTESIQLVNGTGFLKNNKIPSVDFLKIDVEGAEYDVLQGMEEYLEQGNIRMIQFEYGYINITTKKLLIDYYNYFESKGYVIGKIFPKRVEFRKYEFKHEDFIGPNFIAIRKSDTELFNLLKNR